MIQPTQEETWAFKILDNEVIQAEAVWQRAMAARGANIKLLEFKYNAVHNPQTGNLEPLPDEEVPF